MHSSLDTAVVYKISLLGDEGLNETAARKLLCPEEIARADRFLRPELTRRWSVCRAALRLILAKQLSVSPNSVEFEVERWGKPRLARSSAGALPLEFNVSHSGDVAAIAISPAKIGVDVEVPDVKLRVRAIASQVLSDSENEAWQKIPAANQADYILQLWTCKEALLKAMGLGIAEGLKQISFPIPIPHDQPFSPLSIDAALQMHIDDDGTCRSAPFCDRQHWRMFNQTVEGFGNLAVASERHVARIELCDFEARQFL